MTDRGQSEALGFVLVFTLVLATVSLLTVAGLGELQDVRDAQRVDNVHESMQVLADNVDELVVNGAPVRETELRLGSGDLAFGEPVTISVSGHATADSDRNFSYEVSAWPLVYEAGGDQRVVYTAGGVVWQGRTGASMTNGPPVLVSPDGETLTVVQTRRTGETAAVGGTSTALVRAHRAVADLYEVNHRSHEVAIRIESPRAEAWESLLADQLATTCTTPSDGVVSCTYEPDRLSISVVRIDLELR
jgi:hypothetical protein